MLKRYNIRVNYLRSIRNPPKSGQYVAPRGEQVPSHMKLLKTCPVLSDIFLRRAKTSCNY